MGAYLARRLAQAALVLLGVSILVFSMMYVLPGDPVLTMLGEEVVSADVVENAREQLRLNDPLVVQYGRFLTNALRGDLGRSWRTHEPVTKIIVDQFPATLQLTVAGLGLAIVFGGMLGLIAAIRPYSLVDNVSMFMALIGVSMPSFWLGLLLIFLFSLHLNWIPATGYGGLERLILPAVTLGLQASAIIARLVRASMLEVLRDEYITTARAKGITERLVVGRHALRNALIPVVTVIGLQFGGLLGGAVIIETIFARQGIGRVAVTAITGKDFPLVQGIVLFAAAIYVASNLAIDILYAWLDPRIRYS
ncbi:MAG: ABC transporter permease [Chloroflexota bacterium]|nr:ABC transporter permease [Chloroflexota bacterium]